MMLNVLTIYFPRFDVLIFFVLKGKLKFIRLSLNLAFVICILGKLMQMKTGCMALVLRLNISADCFYILDVLELGI